MWSFIALSFSDSSLSASSLISSLAILMASSASFFCLSSTAFISALSRSWTSSAIPTLPPEADPESSDSREAAVPLVMLELVDPPPLEPVCDPESDISSLESFSWKSSARILSSCSKDCLSCSACFFCMSRSCFSLFCWSSFNRDALMAWFSTKLAFLAFSLRTLIFFFRRCFSSFWFKSSLFSWKSLSSLAISNLSVKLRSSSSSASLYFAFRCWSSLSCSASFCWNSLSCWALSLFCLSTSSCSFLSLNRMSISCHAARFLAALS